MRKLFFIVLVTIAAGYSAMWYIQAEKARQQVEQVIAKLNEKQPFIVYDAISISGYPKDVVVVMHKPVISGRIDLLFKTLAEHMKNEPQPPEPALLEKFQTLPAWEGKFSLDGTLSLRMNALSDRYAFISNGSWQTSNTIDGVTEVTHSNPSAALTCTVELARSHGWFKMLWNVSFDRNDQQIAEDFRMLDCVIPASTIVNTGSNETLISNGDSRIFVSRQPKAERVTMRVYIKSTDAEFTPAGQQWMEQYLHLFTLQETLSNNFLTCGKQNAEIDFNYDGPADFKSAEKDTPFDIHLSKFVLDCSKLYSTIGQFQLQNVRKGSQQNVRFLLKANSSFTPAYNAMIQESVRSFIDELYKNNDPDLATIKASVQQYSPEQLYTIAQPAIPDFSSLGKLVQNIDITYQGASDMTAGDLTIADLEFSAADYGITSTGAAKKTTSQMFPSANITLSCANCLRMIDDITRYASRVAHVTAYFDPKAAASMTINPNVVTGFKQFIATLSDPAQTTSNPPIFTYAIVSDGAMGITVNGRPMDQVMALYAEHVSAAMQPASGRSE